MKIRFLLSASALVLLVPGAFAADAGAAPAGGGLTRAEVRAELLRARASGELEALHAQYAPGYLPGRATVPAGSADAATAAAAARISRAATSGTVDSGG